MLPSRWKGYLYKQIKLKTSRTLASAFSTRSQTQPKSPRTRRWRADRPRGATTSGSATLRLSDSVCLKATAASGDEAASAEDTVGATTAREAADIKAIKDEAATAADTMEDRTEEKMEDSEAREAIAEVPVEEVAEEATEATLAMIGT